MADLCRIHRQLIYNICTDSRSFTRIFNKTRVNYKLFFILTQKLESTSFHLKNWHLVELFFIFWHCFLIVYLQTKRREISKSKYQNWYIFRKICREKHKNKQMLLYILKNNTIWPSDPLRAHLIFTKKTHCVQRWCHPPRWLASCEWAQKKSRKNKLYFKNQGRTICSWS